MTEQEKRISEIKAREEAAFGGEWKHSAYRMVSSCKQNGCVQRNICNMFGLGIEKGLADAQYDADADFIAHARQDIPWLIGQLEAALREKAARENPLTCDGCKHIATKYSNRRGTKCLNCSRGIVIPDHYEPKGAARD